MQAILSVFGYDFAEAVIYLQGMRRVNPVKLCLVVLKKTVNMTVNIIARP